MKPIIITPRVRFVMTMEATFRHWLAIFITALYLFNTLAVLAPILMASGITPVGNVIYDLYGGFISHQYANRSYFLFGEQLMYTADELPLENTTVIGEDANLLKAYRGDQTHGWKFAYSDRMTAMALTLLICAMVYALIRKRAIAFPLWLGVALVAPLILDGATHMLSDNNSVTTGFRYDNGWLAALLGTLFPPEFYVGDGIGTFNWWVRLLTSILWGIGFMGFSLARVEPYFLDRADMLKGKIDRWWEKQRKAQEVLS